MNLVNNNTITQYILILTNVFALNDQSFSYGIIWNLANFERNLCGNQYIWSRCRFDVLVQACPRLQPVVGGWGQHRGNNHKPGHHQLFAVFILYITCFTFQIFKC